MAKKPSPASEPSPDVSALDTQVSPPAPEVLTPEQDAIAFLTQKYDALYNDLRARVDALAAHHLQTYGKAI